MRNLSNILHSTWDSPPAIHRPITATAWDGSTDSLIVAYGPSEDDASIELVRVRQKEGIAEVHERITSWDAPCPNPELACDQILSLHFFGDTLAACLVLAGGDIVVVREEALPGEDRIEIAGSIDVGVTAARWSPDEELLAITTKADTLVFMSRSFEGITDIAMTAEDLKASNHVSVGWGKKETQFQGKGAKALRDPTMPEKVDEGVLSSHDDGRVIISWRGDGAYVAISSIQDGLRRLIRVYSREGELDSGSEPVDGLEGALSWRPAGNLIAGVQRLTDRIDVVFFERNGLRHGQFPLRLGQEEMNNQQHITLAWNSDSSVLAVILAGSVQLWTMGNYHWYLKQELRFDENESFLMPDPVVWHVEKALKFFVARKDRLITLEYFFTIARGTGNDYGRVAVIDGQTLKLTSFQEENVPPPMAQFELEIPSTIIDVAFGHHCGRFAVLHHGGISILSAQESDAPHQTPLLKHTCALDSSVTDAFQQISFSGKEEIVALQSIASSHNSKTHHFVCEPVTLKLTDHRVIDQPLICRLFQSAEEALPAFVQTTAGEIQPIHIGEGLPYVPPKLHEVLPWVDILQHSEELIAFGLSGNGHLYANSRLLVKNCTSFLTTPEHLIFTTTTHLLKFVHITSAQDLEVPRDDPEVDERCRSIERGARLVVAIPNNLSLVLQMPRGNLETIFPRAMVLAGIRRQIEAKQYRQAFLCCRTHRVDMNLLYDHAPEQFMENVTLFIDQVKKVSYIDLFLSSLREEDVTETMYKETRPRASDDKATPSAPNGVVSAEIGKTSKINRICDAMLEVFKHRTTTNLKNIITANVCKNPPALEDGLQVVAQLMGTNEDLADKAVEHICFLADVNRLYDNALGLYNLELAILVAQQSQKDPREYLPFMQNLQQMSELRRQCTIDDHLGRHAKALTHLHRLNAFKEVCAYTKKHVLYQDALSLYRYDEPNVNAIMHLYAIYLESVSNFREAGIAYEYLHLYTEATASYQRVAGLFREALFCASQQTPPLSGAALSSLATSLADALYETKDYYNAAQIHIDYNNDLLTGCRLFCKGYHFATAMQLAGLRNQPHLLTEVIDVGLTDGLASSTELLAECKAQLLAQVPRIRELRLKAIEDPLAFYEGQINEDIPDDISVAASSRLSTAGGSLFTRYTGRMSEGTAVTGMSRVTSKNRRREERKRARGKKGSVYEEEYLVASVGRLIERVESVREEIERLVTGLMRRGMRERALAVENLLGEVVGMCKACVGEVFGSEEEKEVGYRAVGADAVLQESMEARGKKKEIPVIGSFEKLSLLGA